MALILGKRKYRSGEKAERGGSSASSVPPEDAQGIFRRHFETHFKPLQTTPLTSLARPTHKSRISRGQGTDDKEDGEAEDEADDRDGSEWGGLSEDEDRGDSDDDQVMVEIVDHSSNPAGAASAAYSMTKQELKVYMSSRPPSLTADGRDRGQPDPNAKNKRSKSSFDNPEDSADLLANDLALQRLLAESHLLSSAAGTSSTLLSTLTQTNNSSAAAAAATTAAASFAAGRLRARTTDLRLQALGSKDSIFSQKKMPIAQRKGIVRAGAEREAKRRKEARECGIVLEKKKIGAMPGSSSKMNSRSASFGGAVGGIGRRVGAPAVGKMRGAELRLSRRDVRDIEGVRGGGTSGGKRRRRR